MTKQEKTEVPLYTWDYFAQNGIAEPNREICVVNCGSNPLSRNMHVHDFFTFTFIEKRSSVIQIGEKKFDDLDGKVVLFQPGTEHAYLTPEPREVSSCVILIRDTLVRRKLLYMLADLPILSDFFLNGLKKGSRDYLIVDISKDSKIPELVKNIRQESLCAHRKGMEQQILEAQFLLLLMRISHIYQQDSKENERGISVDKVLLYISSHAADVTIQSLAEHFSYHPNYITDVLHKKTGKSFTEIKHCIQMENACRLLSTTSYPVQTIAMMVGFENQQYFYRLFKKFTGITPQEYRKQGASFGQKTEGARE